MAGLVPAIHVLLLRTQRKDVDARHKAGHDDECVSDRAALPINAVAMQYIKPEITANKGIFPDQELLTKLEMLKDLDRKHRALRSRMWTEIKLK